MRLVVFLVVFRSGFHIFGCHVYPCQAGALCDEICMTNANRKHLWCLDNVWLDNI